MILFGDGGTLKSLLALYFAGRLAERDVRVLFCDWRLTEQDHRLRLEDLFGDMPPVEYCRCDKPLVHELDRLRRIVRAKQTEYLMVDSVAVTCNGLAEDSSVAAEYFRALRSLEIGSLNIAHVNKSDSGDIKPFGSTFWSNLSRSVWNIRRSTDDGDAATVGLLHRKANLSKLHPALGFELTLSPERTVVRRVSVADAADLAGNLPLRQRMAHAVRSQPMTAAALADELSAKVETIERTARRCSRTFTRVSGSDGITRVALADRRTS